MTKSDEPESRSYEELEREALEFYEQPGAYTKSFMEGSRLRDVMGHPWIYRRIRALERELEKKLGELKTTICALEGSIDVRRSMEGDLRRQIAGCEFDVAELRRPKKPRRWWRIWS